MVERSELITVCRQIGGMMEAGVDILRVTRVLRAQTENPRLLELYDALDHDLKMGRSLADAVERAPDVFSPFAVSLVQQGEEANDLAGAFLKFADFLQQEEASSQHSATRESATHQVAEQTQRTALQRAARAETFGFDSPANIFPAAERPGAQRDGRIQSDGHTTIDGLPQVALDELIKRLQLAGLQALRLLSCLLLCLAAVCAMAEVGWLQRRWLSVALPAVAALFLAATGVWLRRRVATKCRAEGQSSAQSAYSQPADETSEAAANTREIARGATDREMKLESRRSDERSAERSDETNVAKTNAAKTDDNGSRNNQMTMRPASSLSEEDYE